MANTKSAGKRARQTVKRTLRNRSVLTRLRARQRKFKPGATADPNELRGLISDIDKAVKHGTIHRNAANRRKSRLSRLLASAPK